jgi:hypothetical protein
MPQKKWLFRNTGVRTTEVTVLVGLEANLKDGNRWGV